MSTGFNGRVDKSEIKEIEWEKGVDPLVKKMIPLDLLSPLPPIMNLTQNNPRQKLLCFLS